MKNPINVLLLDIYNSKIQRVGIKHLKKYKKALKKEKNSDKIQFYCTKINEIEELLTNL